MLIRQQIVKDFLYHCFQKDPNLRISAKKLLRHPWMLSIKKSSSNQSPVTPSLANINPDQNNIDSKASSTGTIPKAQGDGDRSRFESESEDEKQLRQGTIKPCKEKMTVYDEAVQRVQEWNEALQGIPSISSFFALLITRTMKQQHLKVPPSHCHCHSLFRLPPLPRHQKLSPSLSDLQTHPYQRHANEAIPTSLFPSSPSLLSPNLNIHPHPYPKNNLCCYRFSCKIK